MADLRAPTPSAAAELCTPDWREQLSQVTTYQRYFREEGPKLIEYLRQSLDLLVQDSPLASPQEFLLKRREKVNDLAVGLENGLQRRLEREQKRLAVLSGTLDALSPLKVLSRGYAVVMGEQGVVRKASEVDPGQRVSIRLAEGSLSAQILDKGE